MPRLALALLLAALASPALAAGHGGDNGPRSTQTAQSVSGGGTRVSFQTKHPVGPGANDNDAKRAGGFHGLDDAPGIGSNR